MRRPAFFFHGPMLLALILVLLAGTAWGAGTCGSRGKTGTSPYVASSNGYADITACLAAVEDESTVRVPAGTGTVSWTGNTLTFPDATTIHLQGPGRTALTVTGGAIAFGKSASKLTGFSFSETTVTSAGRGFVIGECNFTHAVNAVTVRVTGRYEGTNRATIQWPRGLIYDCVFTRGKVLILGTDAMYSGDTGQTQNYLMAEDYHPVSGMMGKANMVYVEDCTFTRSESNWIDTNYGAGYVARFNTVTGNTNTEVHGVQGPNRATKWVEIYHNTTTEGAAPGRWTAHFIRSGSGMIFNNVEVGSFTHQYILLDYQRKTATSSVGACDGTKPWDGNEIAAGKAGAGWPCLDQIGTAGDVKYRGPNILAAGTLKKWPMYLWNNGTNGDDDIKLQEADTTNRWHQAGDRDYYASLGHGAQTTPTTPFNGTVGVGYGTRANRPTTCTTGTAYWVTDEGQWNGRTVGPDGVLYKCTAPNIWTFFYVPYPYPHPMRNGAEAR